MSEPAIAFEENPIRASLAYATDEGDKYYYEHLNSLNPFTGQRIPEIGRAVSVGFTTIW